MWLLRRIAPWYVKYGNQYGLFHKGWVKHSLFLTVNCVITQKNKPKIFLLKFVLLLAWFMFIPALFFSRRSFSLIDFLNLNKILTQIIYIIYLRDFHQVPKMTSQAKNLISAPATKCPFLPIFD